MERIKQLAQQYLNGEISAKALRSSLVVELSILGYKDDTATTKLAEKLVRD